MLKKEKKESQDSLAKQLQSGRDMSVRQQLGWVIKLSIPAILAQVSSIVMQYIDASMVGSLGADSSAAIGLVASSTWLIGGLCWAISTGFSIQVAHYIGAGKHDKAREVLRQSLIVATGLSVLLALIGSSISGYLPIWLRGEAAVVPQAAGYFLVYCLSLPLVQLNSLAGNMLQCSGNMRVPSILNTLMCVLDVIFNAVLIFPTRDIEVFGHSYELFGAGLGVLGAALGTALAELVTATLMLFAVCMKSPLLNLREKGSWRITSECMKKMVKVSIPMACENIILCGAMILTTRIIAPLGSISVAANSFAVTAESFCYMPGYGIELAATTLVGQSIGANRKDLARRFARITVITGIVLMAASGAMLYVAAPLMFAVLTPDIAIRKLGVRVLRIEAFAEPMYGASIVANGCLRGAGDTLTPSIMNLVSIWGVRITLSVILAPRLGLVGVWLAMCIELIFRGILFLIRLGRGNWMERNRIVE